MVARAVAADAVGWRALLIAGVVTVSAGACRLDQAGKGRCLTGADCNPGNACVAEICAPYDAGGQVWDPPLIYVGGLRRGACEPVHGTYIAAEALRRSGFTQVPFVNGSPAFYVAGVNENTRVLLTVTAGMNTNDFWFGVVTSAQADGASAARWRDRILEALPVVTLPCDAGPGEIAADSSVLGIGPPPLWYSTGWLATPTACGGFAFCGRAARVAMIGKGLAPRPESEGASVLAATLGDVSMTAQCADFGTYAVFNVFTASTRYAFDPAWQMANTIAATTCP